MTKRSPALLVCVAVCVACEGEAAFGPQRLPTVTAQPAAFTVESSPVAADLFAVAPGNWVQLTIRRG
jgi:hypothetical protein